MRNGYRAFLLGVALVFALTTATPLAHADPVGWYYYFSGLTVSSPSAPWNGAGTAVSGFLAFSAPLAANASYTGGGFGVSLPATLSATAGPDELVNWSFTDAGVDTFGPTPIYNWIAPVRLDLQTASNGAIDYWDIIAEGSYGGPGGQLILNLGYGGPATQDWENGATAYAAPSNYLGTWSRPVQVTPEPSSWTLLGTGALALFGLGLITDHRRKKSLAKAA